AIAGFFIGLFHLIERFQVLLVGGFLVLVLRQLVSEAIYAFETQAQMKLDRDAEERNGIAERQARIERADRVISFANALLAEVSTLQYDLSSRADIARIAARHEDIEDIV